MNSLICDMRAVPGCRPSLKTRRQSPPKSSQSHPWEAESEHFGLHQKPRASEIPATAWFSPAFEPIGSPGLDQEHTGILASTCKEIQLPIRAGCFRSAMQAAYSSLGEVGHSRDSHHESVRPGPSHTAKVGQEVSRQRSGSGLLTFPK